MACECGEVMAFAGVSFSYSGKKEVGAPRQDVTFSARPAHSAPAPQLQDHLYEKLELGVDLDSRIALVGAGSQKREEGRAGWISFFVAFGQVGAVGRCFVRGVEWEGARAVAHRYSLLKLALICRAAQLFFHETLHSYSVPSMAAFMCTLSHQFSEARPVSGDWQSSGPRTQRCRQVHLAEATQL